MINRKNSGKNSAAPCSVSTPGFSLIFHWPLILTKKASSSFSLFGGKPVLVHNETWRTIPSSSKLGTSYNLLTFLPSIISYPKFLNASSNKCFSFNSERAIAVIGKKVLAKTQGLNSILTSVALTLIFPSNELFEITLLSKKRMFCRISGWVLIDG